MASITWGNRLRTANGKADVSYSEAVFKDDDLTPMGTLLKEFDRKGPSLKHGMHYDLEVGCGRMLALHRSWRKRPRCHMPGSGFTGYARCCMRPRGCVEIQKPF
eukprot:gnl/TRDRNA2_/TRDRNA2_168488_c2_seq1.p1 gnl/TRDRNA2_/TRDRNA2_168488_c2~~gnl/TRDRNA2_/TRDRNA2_168488_c2_seq1.p1  ORF type:complete len:104 (+),score=2.32 gnl/TRDRNA2_/TRDRNA2_168488_c2_seq1:111-422(+)